MRAPLPGSAAADAADKDLPLREDARRLNDLPIGDTLHVVRAFSYFSHLANLAEDVDQNRRRRAHALAGSRPQRGSLADATVSPVLTAHPAEVQCESIFDCGREVVRLLQGATASS